MKKLVAALAFLVSVSAFAAENIPVPDGSYSGQGTWTDNLGGSGTWQMTDVVSQNGHHHVFQASFSDGRGYSGNIDVVFSGDSNYVFQTVVNGNPVTIGRGISSADSYQNFDMRLSATETINESGQFSQTGGWQRQGIITDSQSGRTTSATITLN